VSYGSDVAQVLVVEDDAAIRGAILRGLTEHGHAVISAPTAMSGLELAVGSQPDIVVLDLGLPDVDGMTMLKMLRGASRVPVLVATARDDEAEIVLVLNAGADDYLVKPFSAAQLDARIRAVLRRGAEHNSDPTVTVGGLRIDPRSRLASLDGAELDLTPREFALLHYLAARAGEVISRRELLAEVWQLPYGGGDKTVDVHLSWLRRKLGETAQNPRYLQSVRGVGVRVAAPKD
jgi:DNA-binding response OmpR family regulator